MNSESSYKKGLVKLDDAPKASDVKVYKAIPFLGEFLRDSKGTPLPGEYKYQIPRIFEFKPLNKTWVNTKQNKVRV